MRCIDIMKTHVQSVAMDDTIQAAAEKMALANVGFLPVSDDAGRLVGTITDRDITIRAVAKGRIPAECAVQEVMTRDLVACRPDDDLATVEQLMGQTQKSRLLVTDEGGRLVGVLSLSDIAENEPGRRVAKTLREVAAREAPRH
jgi:CBS domain-containing protein